MPYLGNELATQFQAFATQTITGDGSTGYTLDRAVANGKELLVYINNVKQEEGSGKSYTASGTTITFSAAVASGDSCYVVFLGAAVQTVVPPDGSVSSAKLDTNIAVSGTLGVTGAVTANGGAVFNEDSADVDFRVESNGEANMLFVDGGNDRVGIGTTGGSGETLTVTKTGADATVRINGVASQEAALKLQGNNTATNTFKIASEQDDTGLTIQKWNGSAYVTHIASDANGHVTMPLQSAFFAHANTAQSDLAANSNVDINFGTERFDQNGDFASSVFTAPVTGKYQFNVNVRLNNMDSAAAYYIIYLVTSNKNYFTIIDPSRFSQDVQYFNMNFGVVADMDASDTAKVRYLQSGGSAQTDIDGGASDTPSNFSGYLVA